MNYLRCIYYVENCCVELNMALLKSTIDKKLFGTIS